VLQQLFVGQAVGAILLRSQDVDLSKAQLGSDGMIDVDVKVEFDRHAAPPFK
jgi:hypothetical protein